jgi:MFS family permease
MKPRESQAAQEAHRPDASRRNVLALGWVSFINDTSSKIILPILPLFIVQIGGGGLAVGLVAGVGDALASLVKWYSGHWSDRVGRRKGFVFAGYLVSALAKLALAGAVHWGHVVALRAAERLGKGLRAAPRDALLAESTSRRGRGRGFGLHRAMDSAGAVLGTLVAFALYWWLEWEFRELFLLAGLLALVSLVPLAWTREPRRHAPPAGRARATARVPRGVRAVLLAAGLFALANFSYMFFVLRSSVVFDERMAVAAPILLYALFQFTYTLFAYPAGMLSDRVGRRRVVLGGYVLFAAVSAGFAVGGGVAGFVVLFGLYGISFALVEANSRALVADLAPADRRGGVLGLYYLVTSLAALPAALTAGLLWDLNPAWTFAYGAVVALVAAVVLGFGVREPQRESP